MSSSNPLQPYDCQECGRLTTGTEYHPYWHCVLQKAGQLDIALNDIAAHYKTEKAEAERLARIDELEQLLNMQMDGSSYDFKSDYIPKWKDANFGEIARRRIEFLNAQLTKPAPTNKESE